MQILNDLPLATFVLAVFIVGVIDIVAPERVIAFRARFGVLNKLSPLNRVYGSKHGTLLVRSTGVFLIALSLTVAVMYNK